MVTSGKHLSEHKGAIRRWLAWAVKLAVVLAVVGAVVYWVRFSPVRVVGHPVEAGTVVAEVMGTGTLEAEVQVTVSPKISGRIEQLLVDQGDRVSGGELLVRLDDEELRQQVEIAKAGSAAAHAAVDRLKADRGRAEAVLEQARRSHERVQRLAARNSATQQEFEQATETLAVAQAGLAQADAAITEAEKEVIASDKTQEYHRARLADAEILAPFDGLIVRRRRAPGDVVVAGSPILTLISTDRLWISAWVDETAISNVRPQQPARVVFRSEPERSYPGRVVRLGREADRETREFVVDVEVLELPESWAVGQRAEVYIETGRRGAVLLLPAKAVLWHDGEAGVYVDAGGRARWRPVTLGTRGRGNVEVVRGLRAGQTALTPADPKQTLSDGRRFSGP